MSGENKGNHTLRAAQYMLISALSFTIMNAIIKYIDRFSAFELVFFRATGTFILCITYLLFKGIDIKGQHRKLLVFRGIVGTTAMTLFFLALKELPFGTTISLRYLSPIFAAILAVLFLKEKIKPIQWFFFFMAFAGVLLLKGFDPNVGGIGLAYILAAACLSGAVYVIIQYIGTREHPVVIINYFMFCAMCVTGFLAIPAWQNPIGLEWWLIACIGVLGFLAQLFMTKAFQISATSKIAPFKYLEAVFAVLTGLFFFGETYTPLSLLGIFLILVGMLLNFRVKSR